MNDTTSDSNTPGSWLEICGHDEFMLIRIGGLANMHLAVTIKDFIHNSYEKGYQEFFLDFLPCTGLDSTFMGTLVCLSEEIMENQGQLSLFNVTDQCRKLLAMLGVASILQLDNTREFPKMNYTRLSPIADNPTARLKLIEEAHKRLVSIDMSNQHRFGRFLELLKEDQ